MTRKLGATFGYTRGTAYDLIYQMPRSSSRAWHLRVLYWLSRCKAPHPHLIADIVRPRHKVHRRPCASTHFLRPAIRACNPTHRCRIVRRPGLNTKKVPHICTKYPLGGVTFRKNVADRFRGILRAALHEAEGWTPISASSPKPYGHCIQITLHIPIITDSTACIHAYVYY